METIRIWQRKGNGTGGLCRQGESRLVRANTWNLLSVPLRPPYSKQPCGIALRATQQLTHLFLFVCYSNFVLLNAHRRIPSASWIGMLQTPQQLPLKRLSITHGKRRISQPLAQYYSSSLASEVRIEHFTLYLVKIAFRGLRWDMHRCSFVFFTRVQPSVMHFTPLRCCGVRRKPPGRDWNDNNIFRS